MLRSIYRLPDAMLSYILRGIVLFKINLNDMIPVSKENEVMIWNEVLGDKRGKRICFIDVAALNDTEIYIFLPVSVRSSHTEQCH